MPGKRQPGGIVSHKQRGQAPTGMAPAALFWNGQADDRAETRDNPKLRRCKWPPCRANPGQPCTFIRNGRRVPMAGYHDARTETPTQPAPTGRPADLARSDLQES